MTGFCTRGARFLTSLATAAVLLLFSFTASAQQAHTILRRPINNENPLFVYSSVYNGANPSQLENFWKNLPEDVKPYFGVHVNPMKSDSPETRAWIESVLDMAQKLNAPAIIETEGFNSTNDTPMEYWAGLFDKYPNVIGLNISEISATGGLTGANLDAAFMEKMTRYMEVAATHGGYFIWQDMSWDAPFPKAPHVFVKAGAEPALFEAIRKYGAHVILTHKHNGSGRRFTSDAAVLGFWVTGTTAAWGVHSEGWLWWEGGFEQLYKPSMAPHRSAQPWKSVFSYPDALYGIEWLVAASGGASLFSLEAFFQGYSSCDGSRTTPAFDNVILPLIRQIIQHKLIPDRDAVRARIKAAYRPSQAAPRTLREDHLFTALYGPENSTHYEWLPSTGRYYFIPIIPMLADESANALFPTVIDDEFYKDNLVNPEAKKNFFDNLYPAAGSGGAWFVNNGAAWLFANPNENSNTTAGFDFQLSDRQDLRAAGSLPPHTFGILRQRPGGVSLHISNYRIDSDADVWDNQYLNNEQYCDYVLNKYISNPTDSTIRTTVIELLGLQGERPEVRLVAGKLGRLKSEWEPGELKLILDHNGTMDIEIDWKKD